MSVGYNLNRPIVVMAFLEWYLHREQTFILRQMTTFDSTRVAWVARYRVADNPYPTTAVHFFGDAEPQRQNGLRYKLHQLWPRAAGRYVWLSRQERTRLHGLFKNIAPDLVHAHWATSALYVAPLCRRLHVPLVVHFHGYDASRLVSHPVYRRSLRWLLQEMTFGLTVSENMRQRVLALGGAYDRVLTHYTGVPDNFFRPPDASAPQRDRFVLLQVGRLADIKGHCDALQALELARRTMPKLTLRIVGDGPLRQQISQFISALGIGDCVELLGYRPPEDIPQLMAEADALIAPSYTTPDGGIEGMPNVVVEAMASGLPVIATRHGGIPEAVQYSVPDWLVPEGDWAALSRRILALAASLPLCTKLGHEGHARAQAEFHLPTQNKKLAHWYRRVCGPGATAG
jgi:colanic acid/amylovoran biosynthesis glycosyltransferase